MLFTYMRLAFVALLIGAMVVARGNRDATSITVGAGIWMVLDLVLGGELFGLSGYPDIVARALLVFILVLAMAATGGFSATKAGRDRSEAACLTPVKYPRLWTGEQTNTESPEESDLSVVYPSLWIGG